MAGDSGNVERPAQKSMPAEDVVALYSALEETGVECWLDGGWGVDALLEEQTRPHADLDLIVRVDDVPRMRDALAPQGFELVEGTPDSNFVLRDGRGREIDVHTVRFDSAGNGVYRRLNGEDWVYPAPGFYGRGRVKGHAVRCLSPEVQMLCHTGYELAENDLRAGEFLHERFGVPIPPALRR